MRTDLQRLVHKRTPDQVLLVRAASTPDGRWEFGVDLPRHLGADPDDPAALPLVSGLEVVRQLGLAVGHLHARVPADWAFSLQRADFRWLVPADRRGAGARFRPTATVTVDRVDLRRGQPSGLVARTDLLLDGEPVAVGSGELRCFAPDVYRMVRRHAASPSAPRTPSRGDLREVRQRGPRLDAVLGWPRRDRFVFDHLTDHVPGMLLARAATAAHRRLVGHAPHRSITVECTRFAELDAEVRVHAVARGDEVVTTLEQGQHPVARVGTR